ncbi:antichymotrypsin-2-like isoform X2 [Leguminivora glycinivorella]|uniref:antichymotrypsin-2-like isoform X2 n=1 Tax=Leguminivora glycinivorella TaxID=1035111 RepID=UPI00200BD8D8|nr:antichymotrypsin-2-like isoform X2 [Leguminivora glycinivorella]
MVACVISSLMVVKSQRLLTINPYLRSGTAFRTHWYPQSVLKNCNLSSACLKCCISWYRNSTPFKIIPLRDQTVPMNGKLAQVTPVTNHSMVQINKINLPVHPQVSKRKDHYKLLSLVISTVSTKPVRDNTSINNLFETSVKSDDLNKSSDSMITFKTSVNLKKSPFFNKTSNGRRINDAIIKEVTNTKPKTSTASTSVSLLDVATTEQAPIHTEYRHGTTSTYINNGLDQNIDLTRRDILFIMFRKTLDKVERKFLLSSFNKLTAISPDDRKENGISFLQSGLFLYHLLMSLSITMDPEATREIEEYLGLKMSEADKIEILKRTEAWLPKSSKDLKFRWSSRLVLQRSAAAALRTTALPLRLTWFHGNETAEQLTKTLNDMVVSDSGGSMQETFSEEELAAGVCAAALCTAYVRATWRAAPTLLNDSLPFHDAPAAPDRTSRFFRLNDHMAYSYLHEWDTEAIEIPYSTPGLTLLILVPKQPSLRPLVERLAAVGLDAVVGVLHTMRVAVTLPLYTLRMTLLLPNKLQDMGMPSLLTNGSDCQPVRLSHAVQRLMFWAEAGRNAFKDDGIEWDPRPELEIVVDRPYLFFVRWYNITIMNGVFAL